MGSARAGSARASFESYNLSRLLWWGAEQAPDSVFVTERARRATYGDVQARAAAIASALHYEGVRPGDRVAMLVERGIEAVAAYFGILATGAITIVINERLRPRQIEYVLRHSGATHLIASADLMARQPRSLETTARLLDLDSIPATGDRAPARRLASDVAQIIYTSGSTGLPKGVAFTHDSLGRAAGAVASYLDLGSDERIASLLPFSSVYGLNQLLCAVATCSTLLVELSPLPQQIESALRAQAATVIAAVPPLWLQLLRVPRFVDEPMPALRILQNAGGHLPVDAVRRLRAAQPHARLFLQYGLTEAFRSTYLDPEEVDAHPGSIGRAVPAAEIMVVRDDLTPCDVDEVGELVHRGPTVAAGYWGDPEATERVFRPNPLRPPDAPATERVVFSGDLVRRDPDGRLYFVGRRDRMIKTLGYRVAPDEVTDVMLASGQILEAVVTGEPDGERGERIVGYVVLAGDGSLERLDAYCRSELPRYMQPCRFELRESLPRLAGGKYDLELLRAQLASSDALAETHP